MEVTGHQLWTVRDCLGLTQADLAEELGVHANTLARYERGEVSIPAPVEKLLGHVWADAICNWALLHGEFISFDDLSDDERESLEDEFGAVEARLAFDQRAVLAEESADEELTDEEREVLAGLDEDDLEMLSVGVAEARFTIAQQYARSAEEQAWKWYEDILELDDDDGVPFWRNDWWSSLLAQRDYWLEQREEDREAEAEEEEEDD